MAAGIKLLIAKEKFGDRYFTFSNELEFYEIIAFIAFERLTEGNYYPIDPDVDNLSNPPKVPFNQLSDGVQVGLLIMQVQYPSLRHGQTRELCLKRLCNWMLVRRHFEYEGFDIEEFETPNLTIITEQSGD